MNMEGAGSFLPLFICALRGVYATAENRDGWLDLRCWGVGADRHRAAALRDGVLGSLIKKGKPLLIRSADFNLFEGGYLRLVNRTASSVIEPRARTN